MSARPERAVLGEVPRQEPEASANAQAGARARESSLAPAPVLPPEETPSEVTQRDYLADFRARMAARAAEVTSGASLLHSRPPSLAEAREHHHAAAGHFNGWLLRDLRLAWGYVHLLVKAVLNTAEWVAGSPPRLAAAVVFLVIIWLWH